MAFVKKTWVDRVVQHPGRRLLTATGTANEYDVTRAEGTVTQAGDAFSAANMNDLETRVEAGFNNIGVPGFFDKDDVADASSYWTTDVTTGSIQSADATWNFSSLAGNIIKVDIFSRAVLQKTSTSAVGYGEFCFFDAESFFATEMESAVSSALGFVITNTTLLDARKHSVQFNNVSGANAWQTDSSYVEPDTDWNGLTVGGYVVQTMVNYYDIHYEAWIQLS